MPIPDFQTLMLPVLKQFADGKEKTPSDVRGPIAAEFKLTADDLSVLLPSGRQATFANRVAWALGYLKQSNLLESPRRAHYQISERGRQVLQSPPPRIDISFLEQYPDFQAFRNRGSSTPEPAVTNALPVTGSVSIEAPLLTPDEQIRAGATRIKENLAAQLLEKILRGTPEAFENLVVDLLVAMGYGGSQEDAAQSSENRATAASMESLRKTAWALRASTCRRSAGKVPLDGQLSSNSSALCTSVRRARVSSLLLPASQRTLYKARKTSHSRSYLSTEFS